MNWVTVTVNGSEVSVAFDENSVHIYNAFPIKDDLKVRGYRWNPSDKSWYIKPGDVDQELAVLKNNLSAPDSVVPFQEADEKKELAAFPDSYSVADLRHRIDRLIREGIRGNVWVRGVIASDVKHYKWMTYLDLKDEDEKRDMFFRVEVKKPVLEKITRKLADSGVAQQLERDLPVFVNVEVFLPLRNVMDVRLSLLDILPEYTQSKIRNQRDITLETLKQEGILDNQKRLVMPVYISRMGLITSGQGTSAQDIRAGLHPYGERYDFYFIDSRMEGANAVDSIIRALDYLENNEGITLDAIIIARGGGSEQSLAVFNDLRLCRRVCEARLPVLTAIGHEKDISAIELCSWLTPTPSTPSGIGKYLQNRYLELQEQLSGTVTSLIHHFTTLHQREMEKIKGHLKTIPTRGTGYLKMREERFLSLTRGLERAMTFTVRDQERRMAGMAQRLIKSGGDLLSDGRRNVEASAVSVLERGSLLNRRERMQVEKTIMRLDFEKRGNENIRREKEIRKMARQLLGVGVRSLENTLKEIEGRRRLVQANDPGQVLKRGFTLVYDDGGKIIKSVTQFKDNERALLRFHDGAEKIKKDRDV